MAESHSVNEVIDLELLEAAKNGIKEYLSSTRGAHFFGASSTIEILSGETLIIKGNGLTWTMFTGFNLR